MRNSRKYGRLDETTHNAIGSVQALYILVESNIFRILYHLKREARKGEHMIFKSDELCT